MSGRELPTLGEVEAAYRPGIIAEVCEGEDLVWEVMDQITGACVAAGKLFLEVVDPFNNWGLTLRIPDLTSQRVVCLIETSAGEIECNLATMPPQVIQRLGRQVQDLSLAIAA